MFNVKGRRYVKSLYFPIINKNTNEKFYPLSHVNWRFNEEKINQLLDNDEIYFDKYEKNIKMNILLNVVKNNKEKFNALC